MAKTISIILLLLTQIACAKTKNQCHRDPTVRGLAYFGHRLKSTSGNDIENSMQALEHAVRDDFIIVQYEFDIRTTKDKQLIIMHDDTTCATTGIRANVKNNNYKDLPILLDGSDIPTLEQFAAYFIKNYKNITKPVVLDAKDVGHNVEKFVEIVEILKKWVKVEIIMEGGLVDNNRLPYLCEKLGTDLTIRQFDPTVRNLCRKK